MKMTFLKRTMMVAGAAVLATATTAAAATLNIVGGTAGTIPGGSATNELLIPLGLSNPLPGTYGATITASATDASSIILVEVMGFEAGFNNTFAMGTGSYTSPGGFLVTGSPLAHWAVSPVTDGALAFSFSTSGPGGSVANGANPDNTVPAPSPGVNFFAHDDGAGHIWLFFDDDGSNNDDNHDDLAIRLSVVPLPAGALLLISGLGALALRRRRKAA